MSASVRHPEDETPMDVKMFIPYDSAKLCITQVCSYHPLCFPIWTIVYSVLFSLFIRCNLSQNILVKKLEQDVFQEFWFASCISHMSVTPSVALSHGVGMKHLI